MKQTVTIDDGGSCRKLMKVSVDAAEVAQQVESVTKEFQKMARIPGFRPGHTPRALIEKRFAKEIQDEVQRKVLPESYRQAVSENKLRVVMMPQIDKVEFAAGQPLAYEAKLEVAPDFPLPEYKGIAVKKKSAVVSDDDLDKALTMLRDQRAEFADVAGRGLQMDDYAVIRYSAVCEGKPILEAAPGAKLPEQDKDFWMMMSRESLVAGFCDQLVGAKPGDRVQALVDFPANYPQPALAGRKATFFVEVKGIKEKKLALLDDALAQALKAKDLADLKARVGEDLAKHKEAEASADARNQIMDFLLRSTQFELPQAMVAEETKGVVYDLVRENMMRGISKEEIDSKKDEIFGFANKSAQDRVRAGFILSRIAEEEKIQVEKKEVDERIQEMARRYQIPVSKFRAKLEERGGELEIEEQILRAKTLDFLESNARLEPA